jgi:glucose-6-phosphate dehydrogenase assembly protein OpcA
MWPDADLAGLSRVIATNPRISLADLSWTRLGLWRRLTADAFDEPHCRALLPAIRRVEVVHGCGPGARLRALLFACWFAAQVGWTTAETRDRVNLSCRQDDDATGVGILSVSLTGENVEVCVRKNHGEQTATAIVNVPDACGLPRKRAFWPADDPSLLSQELDCTTAHRVYERALALAAVL